MSAPAAPSALDLPPAYDTGWRDDDDLTSAPSVRVSGTSASGATVRVFVDGQLARTLSNASANWTASLGALQAGAHTITATAANDDQAEQSSASLPLRIVIDRTPPRLVDSAWTIDLQHALEFRFDQDVSGSVEAGDLQVVRTDDGGAILAGDTRLTYDQQASAALFTFPGYRNGALPDGNYRATLAATSVTDAAGNSLEDDVALDFFVLAGDANRDRKVDFGDLAILAQNYNTSGKPFSQGNFDYDAGGNVDFNDLAMLAQRYNTSLAPPAAPLAQATAAAGIFNTTPVRPPARATRGNGLRRAASRL
jgi:hypothetical protein